MKNIQAKVIDIFSNYKSLWIWILSGLGIAIFLQILTHLNIPTIGPDGTPDGFLNSLERFLAYATAVPLTAILNLFGINASIETAFRGSSGMFINLGDFKFRIIYECTGIYAWIAYSAATLAYPTSIKNRLLGFAIGIPAIYIVNLIRFIFLGIIGAKWPSAFEFAHAYLWQIIIIGFVVFLFWGFVSWIAKNSLTQKN
jgi:archaeosortase B (VPXXXP-CTERM-specific)